jgi:hypothetical protein
MRTCRKELNELNVECLKYSVMKNARIGYDLGEAKDERNIKLTVVSVDEICFKQALFSLHLSFIF